MAKKTTDELIARVKVDPAFRRDLLTTPEATLEAAGFEADPGMIEAIREMSAADLEAMVNDFEKVSAARKAAV